MSKKIKDWVRNKARNKVRQAPGTDGTSGYIYVVHLGIENIYKIGRATDFNKRFLALRSANPYAVGTIVQRVANMYRCEAVLHRRFKKQRMERECYRFEPGDLDRIRSFLDKNGPKPMVW